MGEADPREGIPRAEWVAVPPKVSPPQQTTRIFSLPTSGRPSSSSSPGLIPQDPTFLSKRHTSTIPNQTFPFPCSVSRREMAEDQPRLYVQMAEDQPHLYTQMAEDQPHLYVQMPELGTNGVPSERQSPPELAARAGSVLTFHNICYRVRTKTGHLCFQKTAKKEVLRDVKYVSKFQHLFRICVSFISVWRAKLMPLSHSAQHADEDIEKLFVFAVSCAKAQVSVPRLSLYTRELNSLGPGDTALLAAIGTGHTSQLCWFYTPWQSSHCARVFS